MLKRLIRQLTGSRPAAGAAAQPAVLPQSAASLAQALALMRERDYAGAANLCELILEHDPTAVEAWAMLGAIALEQGDNEMAREHFEKALSLSGDRLQTLCNAAEANRQAGRYARALELTTRALAVEPEYGPAMHIRALTLQSCWRMDEALALYHRLVDKHPDLARPYDSYLFLLALTGANAQTVLEAHRRWAQLQVESLRDGAATHAYPADPLRRLRVGYVSSDLRDHAASSFIEPILAAHDSGGFEVHCYSTTEKIDATTARLRGLVAGWRDIRWEDDAAVAGMIRADGIDILVDLSGHTGGNRLGVFARKPAPVQLTYLGYPCTTGMSAMDYRLTDGVADPVGIADSRYTERLLRLPCSLWCFRPPASMPEPGPLPAVRSGHVTFGSLNSLFKLTPQIIALWSTLLLSVPGSRLLLATIPEGEGRDRIVAEFERHGVTAQRLSIHPALKRERFWDLHQEIDIALDTYPCNGGATTCETLWSGVPVISLVGDLFQSRAGLSLLSAVGLPELVAHGQEDYLRIARELAADHERLLQLRQQMRQRMRASPLLDAQRFTRHLEALYHEAWRDWCGHGRHA